MKKVLLGLILLSVLSFSGCKDLDNRCDSNNATDDIVADNIRVVKIYSNVDRPELAAQAALIESQGWHLISVTRRNLWFRRNGTDGKDDFKFFNK